MTEEAKQQRTLVKKIAKVMVEVDRVQTDKRNAHLKMEYSSIDAVFDAIRKPLAEQAVIMLPSVTSHQRDGDTVTLEMRITFIDGDSGEQMAFDWTGQGQDRGDKAVAKATTSTLRTALLKAFMLPMGDDPEQDSIQRPPSRKPRQEKPAPQETTLAEVDHELLRYVDGDMKEKFIAALCKEGKIKKPEDLSSKALGWVLGKIKSLDKLERGAWIVEFANK